MDHRTSPSRPQCPRRKGVDVSGKICQAAIFDRSLKWILIVHENSWPIENQRWGLPKGKFGSDEKLDECLNREVCEEVGIDLTAVPISLVIKFGMNRAIILDDDKDNINIYPDMAEIDEIVWADINWLMEEVDADRLSRGYGRRPRGLWGREAGREAGREERGQYRKYDRPYDWEREEYYRGREQYGRERGGYDRREYGWGREAGREAGRSPNRDPYSRRSPNRGPRRNPQRTPPKYNMKIKEMMSALRPYIENGKLQLDRFKWDDSEN